MMMECVQKQETKEFEWLWNIIDLKSNSLENLKPLEIFK